MALYQIDIVKQIGTEQWSNVYHAECADNAAANVVANSIVSAERPAHASGITFVLQRVRLAGSGHVGFSAVLNVLGTRTAASSKLPLFNVVRVDFANAAARPARKYLRIGLTVGDLGGDFVTSSAVQTAIANYVTAIIAIAAMRDPAGRTLSAGAGQNSIAMHQLRRGNRRKPII